RDALVREAGYRVDLVRESDIFMPLNDRVSYVNSRKPDIFLSIHVNDSASAASAVETFYFGPYSSADVRAVVQRESKDWSYSIDQYEKLSAEMKGSRNLQESKLLAASIQKSLLANAAREKEGVAEVAPSPAPFVVLFGVRSPS